MLGAIPVKCGEKTFLYLSPEGDSYYLQVIVGNKLAISKKLVTGPNTPYPTRLQIKDILDNWCSAIVAKRSVVGNLDAIAVDPEVHTVGAFPLGVVGGHFDGDGALDLAVVNQNSNNASVLLGIPGGATTGSDPSFSDAVNYPAGIKPRAIRTGDLDEGDGADLLTVNLNDFVNLNLSLLSSNGDGSFAAPQTLAAGTQPADATIGFLDGDSHLDIAAADTNEQRLVLLFGNGDGTFEAPVNLATPGYPGAVVAADLDLDLDLDLVTNDAILLGNGDGSFEPGVLYTGVIRPFAVAVADVDEDGLPDIVSVNLPTNTVSIYLNDGAGGVEVHAHYVVGQGAEHLEVFDLDVDGHLDVAVSNWGADHLSVLYGRGDGGFEGAPVLVSSSTVGSYVEGMALAQLNDDSFPDLVVCHGFRDAAILPGVSGGGFGPPIVLAGQQGSRVAAGRFDDDALDDLVFSPGPGAADVVVRLRSGSFSFAAPAAITLPEPGATAERLLVVDLNDDTFPDLAAANNGAGGVSLLIGAGNGSFAPQPALATALAPHGLASGFLDDDGLPDMAVANRGNFGALDGSVSVLLSNAPQGFAAPLELLAGTAPDAVAIADFNLDGQGDLAVSLEHTQFHWGIRVLLGDGLGGFGPPSEVAVPTSYFVGGVQARDLNGDRRPDLLAQLGGADFAVMLGRGDGTFGPGVVIDDGNGGDDPLIADVDGDGLEDVIAGMSSVGAVALLLNRTNVFVDGFESGDVSIWTASSP